MQVLELLLFLLFSSMDLGSADVNVQLKYKVCANRHSRMWRNGSQKSKSVVMCGVMCSRTKWCRAVTVCPEITKGYECHFHFGIFDATCESFQPHPVCKMMLEIVKSTEPISPEGCENGGEWVNGACKCLDGFVSSHCERYIKDCQEGKEIGLVNKPGDYDYRTTMILPPGATYPFETMCNFREGKAIMMYRDQDVALNWNRTWEEYKYSFGDTQYAYWMGLEHVYTLTNSAKFNLQIYLNKPGGSHGQMFYTNFKIASEANKYKFSFDSVSVETIHGMKNAVPDSDPLGPLTTDRPFCTWNIPGCTAAFQYGGWWHTPGFTIYSLTKLDFPLTTLHLGHNVSVVSVSVQLIRIV